MFDSNLKKKKKRNISFILLSNEKFISLQSYFNFSLSFYPLYKIARIIHHFYFNSLEILNNQIKINTRFFSIILLIFSSYIILIRHDKERKKRKYRPVTISISIYFSNSLNRKKRKKERKRHIVLDTLLHYSLPSSHLLFDAKLFHLPYKRIVLSTSPREFFAAQRYVPTSCFWRFFIVRIIRTSNGDFSIMSTTCCVLDIIIIPFRTKGEKGYKICLQVVYRGYQIHNIYLITFIHRVTFFLSRFIKNKINRNKTMKERKRKKEISSRHIYLFHDFFYITYTEQEPKVFKWF